MRLARTLALGTALLIGVAACIPRAFNVECVGPRAVMDSAECHEVADNVARLAGPERVNIGRLMEVSVERVDCLAVGLTQEIPELTTPSFDRCWRVVLDYEDDGVEYIAALDGNTRGIGLYE